MFVKFLPNGLTANPEEGTFAVVNSTFSTCLYPKRLITGADYTIVTAKCCTNPDQLIVSSGALLGYIYYWSNCCNERVESENQMNRLLTLWQRDGLGFLKRLNGSFTLFLHDSETGESLISTDRYGTYPLWALGLPDHTFAVCSQFDVLASLKKGTLGAGNCIAVQERQINKKSQVVQAAVCP